MGRLSDDRIQILDRLGFLWDPFQADFQRGLQHLEEFVRRNGHGRVPQTFVDADGYRLGVWCNGQRRKNRRDQLSGERRAELDRVGFVWQPMEARWQIALAALRRFVDREGNADVPAKHIEGEFRLGVWCGERRQDMKHGRLTRERRAILESIPEWKWNPRYRVDRRKRNISSGLSNRR